jgi:membrane protease YdiL (CAAX protease family)
MAAEPEADAVTETLLGLGMIGVAVLGERISGLRPPRLAAGGLLDGLAVGLLVGAVAQAGAAGLGVDVPTVGLSARTLLLAPIAEERLFRGCLSRALGPVPSSILFAAVHGSGALHLAALAAMGLGLWWAFEQRGLAASVGLHAGMNACVTEL